jgi:kynurenine formamidase
MAILEFVAGGSRWCADTSVAFDLAIPLEFDGAQPAFFAEKPATARPLSAGGFVGDVGRGGSCNCGVYTLAPHCHGTHTECVGHVCAPAPPIAALAPSLRLALLISLEPAVLAEAAVEWPPGAAPDDSVITGALLERAAAPWSAGAWDALIVRTLPNDPAKRSRRYAGPNPAAYFTTDAMQWIVARDIASLVVDLPSLDRADDGGRLIAHRLFWGLPPGSTDASAARRPDALVTELAFVPEAAADGLYLLNLQVPAFVADAAPSRPVIHPVAMRAR